MAIVDALPVVCFCISMLLVGSLFRSPLFLIGAIVCTLAGAGKVLWKFVLACAHRDVQWLNRQFRFLMPAGFALMLLAVLLNAGSFDRALVWTNVSSFPCNLLLGIGLLFVIAMIIAGIKLDFSTPKANWIEQWLNFGAQFCILLAVVIIWYAADYYEAGPVADTSLQSDGTVTVTVSKGVISFDGPGNETALAFYPGAKVETSAYAPLMRQLAENGVDCYLLDVPYHLAFFGMNMADKVMDTYPHERWYVGGHSLGGVAASSFAGKHADELEGLVLLASYPTRKVDEDLQMVTVYGSNDGVVRMNSLIKGRNYAPGDAKEVCIEGGNHALFADYGEQKGDGSASITAEDQQQQTAEALLGVMLGK